MSCSISTTGKSTSSWLDRLRSSKGFPSTTDLDLDRFLTSQSHDSNTSTAETIHSRHLQEDPPLNRHQTSDAQVPDGETQMFGIISNALADLFVMGDSVTASDHPDRKCPRKQSNPRFCIALNSSDSDNTNNFNGGIEIRKNETTSPVSDDNSGIGIVKERTNDNELVKLVENVNCAEEEGAEDKGFLDLDGFSRTEVTVIDTSFAGWKFEKMLFRKNNTWKARDKKSTGVLKLGNKKRKAFAMGKEKDGLDTVKKFKVLNQESDAPKKGSSGACDEDNLCASKSKATYSKTSGAFDKDPRGKQAILNVEGSSCVVHMKTGPRSKKKRNKLPEKA